MLLVIFLDQRECMIEFNKIEVDLTLEKKKNRWKSSTTEKLKQDWWEWDEMKCPRIWRESLSVRLRQLLHSLKAES